MSETNNKKHEELKNLFEASGLNPKTDLTFGIVLKMNFLEISDLIQHIEKNDYYVIYKKASPNKLFICDEEERDVLDG